MYALTAGLDQECVGGRPLALGIPIPSPRPPRRLVATCYPSLVYSVENGDVNESFVDAAAARLLREKFALHLFDGPGYWRVNGTAADALLDAPPHRQLARTAAAAGITLLQNDPSPASPNGPGTPLLPLPGLGTSIRRVALVSSTMRGGEEEGGRSAPCPAPHGPPPPYHLSRSDRAERWVPLGPAGPVRRV